MKVAIVSFGHSDSAIPMTKALSGKLEKIDLYFSFSLNRRRNNIIDFQDYKVTTGLLDEKIVDKIVSKEIKDFINNKYMIHFFIYQDLKLKTIKNWILSLKFFKILNRYDIIHFNGTNGVLPQLLFLLSFKRKIFTIHDYECHSGEKNRKNFFDFNFHFTNYLIKTKNQIVIQNRFDYFRVLKAFPEKAKKLNYVPFGYLNVYRRYFRKEDIDRFEKSDILFFGRISPYKGIEYLIKAIKIVKLKIPSVKVVIAGSGDFNFDISEIKKDQSFKILNRFIPSNDLVHLIYSTKIVVCPYTDATQSGVMMTAFAFNKPVIASDVGGFRDVIHDDINGKLVKPKDSHTLADAIIDLLNHPDKIRKMNKIIEKNRKTGEFSWDSISNEIIKIYNKAVK